MENDIFQALDNCLIRINQGDTIEQCLAAYPLLRAELEPLLRTALALSCTPRATPSKQFRQQSEQRLKARILQKSQIENERKIDKTRDIETTPPRQGIWHHLFSRPLVPVSLVVLLALITWSLVSRLSEPVAPLTALTADYTLTTLRGYIEVQPEGSSEWKTGSDGTILSAGDRIKTGKDSYAVLTFIDGSTTKMEPETDIEVAITEYQSPYSAKISLNQTSGKTWNHILTGGGIYTDFSIQTPNASVAARGTSFTTEIDAEGTTRVTTIEGSVEVGSMNSSVNLAADHQTEIKRSLPPSLPVSLTKASTELVLSSGNTACTSIIDPLGSSTGTLPDGISFNQITNSYSPLSSDGQYIKIRQPLPGEYTVLVRSLSEDSVPVRIELVNNGKTISQYSQILNNNQGKGWIIRLTVEAGSNSLKASSVSPIESLDSTQLEKVVETQIAKERAASTGTAATRPVTNTSPSASPTKTTTSQNSTTTVATPTIRPSIKLSPTASNTPTATIEPTKTPLTPQVTPVPTND